MEHTHRDDRWSNNRDRERGGKKSFFLGGQTASKLLVVGKNVSWILSTRPDFRDVNVKNVLSTNVEKKRI